MVQIFRYLSHPQVIINPTKEIQKWSLNDVDENRVRNLANSGALRGTGNVISSAETKALEDAARMITARAVVAILSLRRRGLQNGDLWKT